MQLDSGLCLLVKSGKYLPAERYRRLKNLIPADNQRFCYD
jgi:hypothetical protein